MSYPKNPRRGKVPFPYSSTSKDPEVQRQNRFNHETTAAIRESAERWEELATTGLVLPKTPGDGVRVDPEIPTYPWHDLLGEIRPKATGAGSPTTGAFRGGRFLAYNFAANDSVDNDFHIPHDYAPGTDLYAHFHWAHNGTAISGTLVVDWTWTYAKGHAQGTFSAESTITQTITTSSISLVPQYSHRIEEVQLSAVGGGSNRLNTDLIEPDGLLLLNLRVTTIPTITGGTPNRPYIFYIDVHYQSTCVGTKQKAPNFYV